MRAFIIVGFLLIAGCAADVSHLGYNYGQGLSGGSTTYQVPVGGSYNTGSLLSSVGGGSLGGSSIIESGSLGLGSLGGSVLGGGSIGVGSIGVGSVGGGSIGGGLLSGSSIGSRLIGSGTSTGGGVTLDLNALDNVPQSVELNKQFFEFAAPEEQQDGGHIQQQLSNVLKKNLQVVFIKAPENNAATNAALQLAKQAIEQKTAIYVLSKENSGSQLVGQLQQIQESVPTTPEVRFIKYRTPGDIAYARQAIQQQYDSIGGTSQSIDGGIAPVLNYASPASSSVTLVGGGGSVIGGGSSLIGGGGSIIGGGGSLIGGGSLSRGGSYGVSGSGVNKIIGGSTTFTTGVSNVPNNYLPASALRKKK